MSHFKNTDHILVSAYIKYGLPYANIKLNTSNNFYCKPPVKTFIKTH